LPNTPQVLTITQTNNLDNLLWERYYPTHLKNRTQYIENGNIKIITDIIDTDARDKYKRAIDEIYRLLSVQADQAPQKRRDAVTKASHQFSKRAYGIPQKPNLDGKKDIKLVVVGDSKTGKSSSLIRFAT
jgi:hypothetical protein